jgi:hypothetical protein
MVSEQWTFDTGPRHMSPGIMQVEVVRRLPREDAARLDLHRDRGKFETNGLCMIGLSLP